MKKHRITVTTDEISWIAESLEEFASATPDDLPEYEAIQEFADRMDKLNSKVQGEPEEGY